MQHRERRTRLFRIPRISYRLTLNHWLVIMSIVLISISLIERERGLGLSSVLSERELQDKMQKIPNVSTHSVLVLELDPLQPGVGQLLIPQKLLRGRLSSHIPTFPQDGQ